MSRKKRWRQYCLRKCWQKAFSACGWRLPQRQKLSLDSFCLYIQMTVQSFFQDRSVSVRSTRKREHSVWCNRVTGEKTGTKQFSELKAGDQIPVIGPMGNGFPLEEAKGKKAFLMGGGIGVPPILELAREVDCAEKQIVVGYRDAHTFLKEEFEQNGKLYIATEDGSVGTKGNVMDAIREQALDAEVIFACGPMPMLRAIKAYAEENGILCYISLEERMACGIGACLGCVCKTKEVDAHSNVHNKRVCKDGPVFLSTEVEI